MEQPTVRDVMTAHVVTVGLDAPYAEIAAVLAEHRINAVPVLDDDTPEVLAARVHAVENELYPQAIALWAEGRLRIEGRRVRILPPDGA